MTAPVPRSAVMALQRHTDVAPIHLRLRVHMHLVGRDDQAIPVAADLGSVRPCVPPDPWGVAPDADDDLAVFAPRGVTKAGEGLEDLLVQPAFSNDHRTPVDA